MVRHRDCSVSTATTLARDDNRSERYGLSGCFSVDMAPHLLLDFHQFFSLADLHFLFGRLAEFFQASRDVYKRQVFFFLFALAVLIHVKPLEHVAFNVFGLDIADTYHMLVSAGFAGLAFSVIALLLVLTATPAPTYLGGLAAERARLIEERLPEAIKALRPR